MKKIAEIRVWLKSATVNAERLLGVPDADSEALKFRAAELSEYDRLTRKAIHCKWVLVPEILLFSNWQANEGVLDQQSS